MAEIRNRRKDARPVADNGDDKPDIISHLGLPLKRPRDDAGYQEGAYIHDQIHLTSLTRKQCVGLRWLFAGLRRTNVEFDNGKPVAYRQDAVRWILERLADEVPGK